MRKLTVETLDDLDTTLRVIRSMLELKGKVEVIVREHKIDRSADQNSLMWLWLTEIGNSTGESKEKLHEVYKEKFLCSIFIRDDPEYAEMAQAIKLVKAHSEPDYLALKKQVVAMTSTTKCSVPQMREYLSAIKQHAVVGLRITLTEPSLQGLV